VAGHSFAAVIDTEPIVDAAGRHPCGTLASLPARLRDAIAALAAAGFASVALVLPEDRAKCDTIRSAFGLIDRCTGLPIRVDLLQAAPGVSTRTTVLRAVRKHDFVFHNIEHDDGRRIGLFFPSGNGSAQVHCAPAVSHAHVREPGAGDADGGSVDPLDPRLWIEQAWEYGTLAAATVWVTNNKSFTAKLTIGSKKKVSVPHYVYKCGDVAAIRRGSKVLVVAVSGDNGKGPRALLAMPNPL
jgi:hypothetical protein